MEGSKTAIHYYVDYGSGDDSTGDGSSGNPWKTIQHALDTITRNTTATAYDQINLKSNATHVLAGSLSFATYGRPASRGQLVIRGYDTTADDGGISSVSGDATHSIANYDANMWYTWLRDLNLGKCGANPVWGNGGRYVHAVNCKFHDGTLGFTGGLFNKMFFCTTENLTDYSLQNGFAWNCSFQSGANQSTVFSCLFDVNSSGVIINIGGGKYAIGNVIRNSAGAGSGINGASDNECVISENIVSGCATGIAAGSSLDQPAAVFGNAIYDCTTPLSLFGGFFAGSNDELLSDPFANWPQIVETYTKAIREQSYTFTRGPTGSVATSVGLYNPFQQPVMGGV